MTRPRLLDLFCGAGGAAVGYHRAGFDVVGVDNRPQPRYPFEFHQGDALTWPLDGYDAIHASPPCQRFSITRVTHSKPYPDLLTPTLHRLAAFPGPWVVENVPGAPLPNPVEICGAAFHLTAPDTDGTPLVLRRHRLFSSNIALLVPPCACAVYRARGVRIGGVYGGGPENRRTANRNLGIFRGGYTPPATVAALLIGADHHMTKAELAQAIPPAYTEHIGGQLLAHLSGTATPTAANCDPMVRNEPLRIYQGDSYVNDVNVSDQGAPADLTGWTATAQIRTNNADLAPDPPTATFTTTIDPVDHSIIHLRLDPVTAANLPDGPLVWDLQVTNGTDVFTLLRGPVYVGKQVTA